MADPDLAPARRGRPTKFDRDAVLAAAVETFWRHGVDATTLADLEDAAGVVRTTIYNSFGGRDGLYRDAAQRYVERTKEEIFGSMLLPDASVDDVIGFLDRLGASMSSGETPTGCLIVNDLTSPSLDRAAADDYLEALRNGVEHALRRRGDSPGVPSNRVPELVDVVVAGVIGANLLCRAQGREAGVAAVRSTRSVLEDARG